MTSDLDAMLSRHVYTVTETYLPAIEGNILEIGAFNGAGTAYIAQKFPDRIVYTIDPFIEDGYTVSASDKTQGEIMTSQRDNFIANTKDLSNVVLFETTSKDFLNICTQQMVDEMNISWVIIDGSHHYDDVIIDSELAIKVFESRSGVVVFDDLEHIGVRRAYHEFMCKYAERHSAMNEMFIEGIARVVRLNPL